MPARPGALAPSQAPEGGEEDERPPPPIDLTGEPVHRLTDTTDRSGLASRPAPLIRQGFRRNPDHRRPCSSPPAAVGTLATVTCSS